MFRVNFMCGAACTCLLVSMMWAHHFVGPLCKQSMADWDSDALKFTMHPMKEMSLHASTRGLTLSAMLYTFNTTDTLQEDHGYHSSPSSLIRIRPCQIEGIPQQLSLHLFTDVFTFASDSSSSSAWDSGTSLADMSVSSTLLKIPSSFSKYSTCISMLHVWKPWY